MFSFKPIVFICFVFLILYLLKDLDYVKYMSYTCPSILKKIEPFIALPSYNFLKKNSVNESNIYIDDKNDANFQSNVLNTNRFYKINNEENSYTVNKEDSGIINSKLYNKEDTNGDVWKYKKEFVMNGGKLFNNVTGYNTLYDNYVLYDSENETQNREYKNDDIRMGMGKLNVTTRQST